MTRLRGENGKKLNRFISRRLRKAATGDSDALQRIVGASPHSPFRHHKIRTIQFPFFSITSAPKFASPFATSRKLKSFGVAAARFLDISKSMKGKVEVQNWVRTVKCPSG